MNSNPLKLHQHRYQRALFDSKLVGTGTDSSWEKLGLIPVSAIIGSSTSFWQPTILVAIFRLQEFFAMSLDSCSRSKFLARPSEFNVTAV